MDTNTIIIFVCCWIAATAVIVAACKLFARYCYKPRTVRVSTQDQANQSFPLDVVTVINGGRPHMPLARQRSQSMPEIDTRHVSARHQYPPVRREPHQYPPVRREQHVPSLPPNYNQVLSHPSMYRRKELEPISRQATLPPPPHYDDLEARHSFPEDLSISESDLRARTLSSPTVFIAQATSAEF